MKPRFIAWTLAAFLLTVLGLGLGCSGTDNNPFGSSAGGGTGGGTPGTTMMTVLSNNTAGSYGSVTVLPLTVNSLSPGVPDPLPGGATSTRIDVSTGNGGLQALFCDFPGTGPNCGSGLFPFYPSYAAMRTWTLKFDIMVSVATHNASDGLSVAWGIPPSCSGVCHFSSVIPSFTTITVTPAMWQSLCDTPPTSYVNIVFGLTMMRPANGGSPGDSVYVDNVRWVQ